MREIEVIEKEFPYSFYNPNQILGAVYGRRMIPREGLWVLETRARAYRQKANSLTYCSEELNEKIREVDRAIAELKAAYQKPPSQSNLQVVPPPEAAPDTPQPPPASAQKTATDLTDADCIQKLVDTSFIIKNTNIKTKTIYEKTRAVTVPKIYNELLKMTNDGERAKRIMLNNISGVEAGLKQHLSRLSKRNKK
jgi:hypothetical protein